MEVSSLSEHIGLGSTLIAIIALVVMIVWDNMLSKKARFFQQVQGPLVAVALGIIYYQIAKQSSLSIPVDQLVFLPVPESADVLFEQLTYPDFSILKELNIWITAITIALIASLETLLCVEATDKLDPEGNVTPTNRELIAQGTGNILAGLVGGLPITQVIARSSANIQSGGKTKASAILHGCFLLASVILIPEVLMMIPLSVLAAILLLVGYKLAKPVLFKALWIQGWHRFLPFIITIAGIVFQGFLFGIVAGLLASLLIRYCRKLYGKKGE